MMSARNNGEGNKSGNHQERVEKFNPYHGKDGRFASASGGTGGTAGGGKKGFKNYSKKDLYDALPGTAFKTNSGEKYVVSKEKGVLHKYNSKGMYAGDTNIEYFYRKVASVEGLQRITKKYDTIEEI